MTLDRTLSYKEHIQNTKMKVATHNNLLKKLANSKWETNASTITTTALALCYSIAGYAAPILARSTYADILDSELNKACRANICQRLVFVSGNRVFKHQERCAGIERTKHMEQETHSLFGHLPTRSRPKSRKGLPDMCETILLPCKSCTM